MRTELESVLSAVREMPAEELPSLIGELENVKAVAWARLSTPAPAAHPQPDELLDVTRAANKLGLPVKTVYNRASRYPFTRREGRNLRFSANGIDAYIRKHH